MKTKNSVLLLVAAMMVFFRSNANDRNYKTVLDLLTDDEYYLLRDSVRHVQEELFY